MTAAEAANAAVVYGFGVLFASIVARQAYARGCGFWSWVALQILAVNPLYPMVLIALLPNKRRLALRERFAAELDAKLAAARPPAPAATVDFPAHSVGELPTAGSL